MPADPRVSQQQDLYVYPYNPPTGRATTYSLLDLLRGGRSIPAPTTPQGQLFGGTADINKFRGVLNPDGSVSTVRAATFGFTEPDGQEVTYLLPTIAQRGFYLEPNGIDAKYQYIHPMDPIGYFREYGQHFGGFSSVDAARAASDRLHRAEEIRIQNPEVRNRIRRLWTDS